MEQVCGEHGGAAGLQLIITQQKKTAAVVWWPNRLMS